MIITAGFCTSELLALRGRGYGVVIARKEEGGGEGVRV